MPTSSCWSCGSPSPLSVGRLRVIRVSVCIRGACCCRLLAPFAAEGKEHARDKCREGNDAADPNSHHHTQCVTLLQMVVAVAQQRQLIQQRPALPLVGFDKRKPQCRGGSCGLPLLALRHREFELAVVTNAVEVAGDLPLR